MVGYEGSKRDISWTSPCDSGNRLCSKNFFLCNFRINNHIFHAGQLECRLEGMQALWEALGRPLASRCVVHVAGSKGKALVLSFAQPSGREQIKTSKKAMKALGKRKLLLEEVKVGAKVETRYYTTLGQMMELIVDHQD